MYVLTDQITFGLPNSPVSLTNVRTYNCLCILMEVISFEFMKPHLVGFILEVILFQPLLYVLVLMYKSCEQRLIIKEHIATHTNLILLFKFPLYPISQSSFISFTTHITHPLSKLKRSFLVNNAQLVKQLVKQLLL